MTKQEEPSVQPARPPNRSPALHLKVGMDSDVGPVRALNEDYAGYHVPAAGVQRHTKGTIFLVADGMGGHQAGEVASRTAVKQVMQEYYADAAHEPGESLVRAFKSANRAIYDQALTDPTKAGMGTTLVAAVILGRRVYVANVGDSRAYLLNEGGLGQITQDHSWVEEQIQLGLLTAEQAQGHPHRNLVTRALGSKPTVDVDLFEGAIQPGNTLLLCSDGLCGPLPENEITQAILNRPPDQAAADLVAQAGARGGEDNATALIISVVQSPPLENAPPATERAPVSGLAKIGDWLHAPGALRLGKKGQRLAVGLAVALLFICLCAAIALLLAVGQKLVWEDPEAAPEPAPLQDGRSFQGQSADGIASFLGYGSATEMNQAHRGQLDPASLAQARLWPAERNLFLAGEASNWQCGEQECTFDLTMAEEPYQVRLSPVPEESPSLNGRTVRVLGHQPPRGGPVTAQFVERDSQWWAWWLDDPWQIVFPAEPWQRTMWIYGTVDQSPYGLLDPEDVADLKEGNRILVRGTWATGENRAAFDKAQRWLYYLDGNQDLYLPVEGTHSSPPLPTATLQPTATP